MEKLKTSVHHLANLLGIDNKVKGQRILLFVLADILVINLAAFLSLWLRFEFRFQDMVESGFLHSAELFCIPNTLIILILFMVCQLYASVWTHAGMHELLMIFIASAAVFALQIIWLKCFSFSVPRSYPFLYTVFLFFGTVCTRFAYRVLRRLRLIMNRPAGARTMLIGAGAAGAAALREFQFSAHSMNHIVCIIDDNRNKTGKRLMGVLIVGTRDDIVTAAKKYNIKEIVFAIPSMNYADKKQILTICQQTGCKLKTLPGMFQLANGEVNVKQIRDVEITDLLGRPEIKVDLNNINSMVEDHVVMVTGGGGSIGSELCRQLAAKNPKALVIFDIYENNAYDIQQELKRKYPDLDVRAIIGSVRDSDCIHRAMAEHKPDLVFHAAAHKHVPLMEDSPAEAIKNNVFGTMNTAAAAAAAGVSRFVLISTDKAVNPTNVMGASKRMCEMLIQMLNARSKTVFTAVRFGNVLGSNGSVIPLFKKQIAEGGPVTVTHPDITRFFMTIPEAVTLVLQACVFAEGGEIFVLDMGEPVKISDLARNMIQLSGFVPDVDIPIVYTGLRPGEKLYEEVLMDEEGLAKTQNDLIFIGSPIQFDQNEFLANLQLLKAADPSDHAALRKLIQKTVPTYHPAD